MHIALHQDFASLSDIELRAHEAMIDRLLHRHLEKALLFCLTPLQIKRLKSVIQFGPQVRAALEVILHRSQDYLGTYRVAKLSIRVLPLGSTVAPGLDGRHFNIKASDVGEFVNNDPKLFVENMSSDGLFYSFLIKQSLHLFGGNPQGVAMRVAGGGGAALGAQIVASVGGRIKGLCICDRDKGADVPPFVTGSTARNAIGHLVQAGAILDVQRPLDYNNPVFKLIITYGWSLENYIGPNLLSLYIESNETLKNYISDFLKVFPSFPSLSDSEMKEWMLINFRDPNQDWRNLKQCASSRHTIALTDDRAALLSGLAIPGTPISWILDNARYGRYKAELLQRLKKDLSNKVYFEAVRDVATYSMALLAADDRMTFA